MSFINSIPFQPKTSLLQQSQLMPLIRQLHQESFHNQNISLCHSPPIQRQFHYFPQNTLPTKPSFTNQTASLSSFHLHNAETVINDWSSLDNKAKYTLMNFPTEVQNNRKKSGNQSKKNMSSFQKKEKQTNSLENNAEENDVVLFTPLGKSMPARTFNFKIKPSKNKQFQKQATYKKPMKNNSNKIKEDTIALKLETKLSTEGKFTEQIYNELKNNFVSLIKVQQISRICQLYLDQTPYNILQLIFNEIASQLSELLLDPYANYFCLKIFYSLNTKDGNEYLSNIASSFPQLCINKISTYPIQCIIEQLTDLNDQQIIFAALTQGDYMKLALDPYGTHVLAKILTLFDYALIQPLSLFILENFLFLANNSNGLCVVKKEIVVEYKKDNFEQLQQELINNALVLVQSPYGNYALQIALDNWELKDFECIIVEFVGKCSVLSIQKFSSNVIEKSIEKSKKFALEFFKEMTSSEGTFCLLLKNSYGNYVIQAALKVIDTVSRDMVLQLILKNIHHINDKKLANKWKNVLSTYNVNRVKG